MNSIENKEQLIDMLTSEDKETRSLAVNSIRNNYDTDFKYTYSHSVNDGIRLKISEKKDEYCCNMDYFLECMLCSLTKKSTIKEILDLIIEYNELKRKQG